jgi:acetylornithine/N-succinyldiaminopimelate aminotransferase
MSEAPGARRGAKNPDPDEKTLLALAQKRLLGNYRQAPFALERGRGCEVFDTEGRRYLDLCAGVAVTALGHAHPRLTAAIAEQAGRLMHASNYFYNVENVRLADELCARLGFDRAFFCNSGTEAVEALIKLARRWFFTQNKPERRRVLAFHNSFHGRTLGALSATGNAKYQEGFGPPLPGVTHVDFGDLDAVRAAMGADVAAILVEPIQGEGGVHVPPAGFLTALRALADEAGALLLIDEVQTGLGRTGTWLGGDHEAVKADAIALAKGLGGGFPIGALLLRERLNAALPPGSHGSTFGGNALASAAARTVLAVLEEERLVEGAATKGVRLEAALAKLVADHPRVVVSHRGRGLLQGVVLAPGIEGRIVLGKLRERGLLLTVAGANVLRFSPPLVVTEAELDEGIGHVNAVLAELSQAVVASDQESRARRPATPSP